jgi:Beta-galactosidase/beta-glucuronidase
MNCNLLRVWGGAILEKQEFYRLCDEMGLMVWQEFPQSSSGINSTPPDGHEFLKELEDAATVFIKRRRHHACHIIWCGGNELTWERFKPVDDCHANIHMLKGLVDKLDSGKNFLPTSPSGLRFCADKSEFGKGVHHDVHGPWTYQGSTGHYEFFNGDDSLFRSETGCPGTSRIETLEKYKGGCSIWPPAGNNPYWAHRGLWWVQLEELGKLFGEWDVNGEELDDYLEASRYLQAEGLRYAAEATRRREPVSSGFIIWMGNEPFPNNSNTSVLEYDGTPKPCYYWLGNTFSRLHVSAKYPKLNYNCNEEFTGSIYVTSDFNEERDVNIQARIIDIKGNILADASWEVKIRDYSLCLGEIKWRVAPCEDNVFILRLDLQSGLYEDENSYLFTLDSKNPLEPIRNLQKSDIELREIKTGEWVIVNNSSKVAVNVFIYGKNPDDFLKVFPNYFILLPYERKLLNINSEVSLVKENFSLFITQTGKYV